MRKFPLFLFVLLVLASHAHASVTPQILIPEDDGWRVHSGDNPAYANSGFDDSSWPAVSFGVPEAVAGGDFRWFRKRLTLPADAGALNLLLVGKGGSYEVYLDGRRAGPPLRSSLTWVRNSSGIFPLRSPGDTGAREIEVAIRSHLATTEFSGGLNFDYAAIGSPAAIDNTVGARRGEDRNRYIAALAMILLACGFGLFLITLFLKQRNHPEYLWLGLSIIFFSLSICSVEVDQNGGMPYSVTAFLCDPFTYFSIAAQLQFIYAFIRRRPGKLVRVYQVLLFTTPFALNSLLWTGVLPNGTLERVEGLLISPGIFLVVALLIAWYRRGSREAGLLILPILLANISLFLQEIETLTQMVRANFAFPALTIDGVRFTYAPLSTILFLVSCGLLVFYRFTQVSQQQAQAEADLESARTIQQILVPEALPTIPGFRIQAVYQPAQQVGGDFFQIIPLLTGGVLAVLGDVSGKGLPAAMNVALLVGTLRTLAETTAEPAAILAGLNRRLVGRSKGFTTAIALRVLPGGDATFAIAGHLNPYLNGSELPLNTGLPLGLIDDAVYTNTPFLLAPGDTLTLLTDGVVEARDPRTQELFGFARTLAVSAKSASEIAATAQRFGQEDDIAVLTLALTTPAIP